MQTDRRLLDSRVERRGRSLWRKADMDRGVGTIKCGICAGPLADHEIGDHPIVVVERMLKIGFPTPVSSRLP